MNRNLIVGMTGASGAVYAIRLIDVLLDAGYDVHLSISPSARLVLKTELEMDVDLEDVTLEQLLPSPVSPGGRRLEELLGRRAPRVGTSDSQSSTTGRSGRMRYHRYNDMMAPVASGSFLTGGMIVCPCSGGTLSGIAHGASSNLIQRAADVHLKERRKLVLVPRETPLSAIQLENMRRCADAGAVVLPAAPGWYHGVTSLADLVDFVVARICDQLGVEHQLMKRWGGNRRDAETRR